MSKFKPFIGVRPKKELISELMLTQFDHVIERHAGEITPEEILDWAKEKGIGEDQIDESLKYFLTVGLGYRKLLKSGKLFQDKTPSYYLIGINWYGEWVYGLIGELGFEEYWSGHVKKHEDTLEENEAELLRITKAVDFNFNPVLLTYEDSEEINRAVETTVVSEPFTYQYLSQEGVEHRFWTLSNPATIEALRAGFKQVDNYYIADGHHRIASGALLAKEKFNSAGNYTSFISIAVPASQLKMYEFNRVVKDLNGLTRDEFLEKLEAFFHLELQNEAYRPTEKFHFGMYFDDQWYSLKVRDATQIEEDPVKHLDVSVLRHFVLTPILGIINVRKSDRIAFLDGSKGISTLEKMVNRGDMRVGFTLCPPAVEEMFAVANHHETMPPKATCIEPKMKSGIISRVLGQ